MYNITSAGLPRNSKMYYIFWVCVCSLSYPACKAHAPYCYPWPVRLYHIFPRYLIKGMIFGGGGSFFNKKCVILFSLQLLYENSHSKEKLSGILPWLYIGLHGKYPLLLSDFNKTRIFSTDFRKTLRFHTSRNTVHWETSCSMGTDRQIKKDMTPHGMTNRYFYLFSHAQHSLYHDCIINKCMYWSAHNGDVSLKNDVPKLKVVCRNFAQAPKTFLSSTAKWRQVDCSEHAAQEKRRTVRILGLNFDVRSWKVFRRSMQRHLEIWLTT